MEGCGEQVFSSFLLIIKNTYAKEAITTFMQGASEPLCEASERFKVLLRKGPNHEFKVKMQTHILCNGLQPQTRMILDASFGVVVLFKTVEEAIIIIEFMVLTK